MENEKLVPKLRFAGFDEEWIKTNLGNISSNEMYGMNSAAKEYDGFNKYIRITDISETSNKFVPNPLTSPEGELESKYQLQDGDIVFARTGASTGKTYLYDRNDGNLYFAGFLIKFHIDKAVPKFIFYNTLKKEYLNWVSVMSVRSGQPGINSTEYQKLPLHLPSIDEQNKISSFLSKIDDKITLLEKKHKLYQDFKKYLMQQIFAQKLRFDKTSEWETFILNDIGKTYNGLSGLSKDNFEKGNSKYITYKSIFDNNILKSDFTENVELNNKSQNEVKKGDLFFTGSSETPEEVGMVSVLNNTIEDCYLNSFCFGFRLDNNYDVNPLFLAYYLRSPIMRNKIMILAQGSTRFNLSKKEILKLKVEIPSINEQQQVIDLFQNVDNKINEISMQIDNFNEFKKGLLQQMFI